MNPNLIELETQIFNTMSQLKGIQQPEISMIDKTISELEVIKECHENLTLDQSILAQMEQTIDTPIKALKDMKKALTGEGTK